MKISEGIETNNTFDRFVNEFFFSTQTLTTVGCVRINPVGVYSNIISSIESLTGLFSLALAVMTSLRKIFQTRYKIIYSDNAIIAPFNGVNAFQFRIDNMIKHPAI